MNITAGQVLLFNRDKDETRLWKAFTHLLQMRNNVSNPDDHPLDVAFISENFRAIPKEWQFWLWLYKEDDHTISGYSYLIIDTAATNTHSAEFDMYALPTNHQDTTLQAMWNTLKQQTRISSISRLKCSLDSRFEKTIHFLQQLGATIGSCHQQYQLSRQNLNSAQLHLWRRRGQSLASIKLLKWFGRYPDDCIDDFAQLYTQFCGWYPKELLNESDELWTAERLRNREDTFIETVSRWTMVAIDTDNDTMIGFSEILSDPSDPTLVQQGDTGINPQYRRSGIGAYIKAELISWVLQDNREINRVRTNNASSNTAMIQLNKAMGYRLYKESLVLQLECT